MNTGRRMQITTELEKQAESRGLTREGIAEILGKRSRAVYNLMKGLVPMSLEEGIALGKIFGEEPGIILRWQKTQAN